MSARRATATAEPPINHLPAERPALPIDREPMHPLALIHSAIEKGFSAEQLGKLMELQERWTKARAQEAFNAAFAAFKAEAPAAIERSGTVDVNGNKRHHVELDRAVAVVVPHLSEHGLSHRWETSQANGFVTVTCYLEHQMGASRQATLSAAPDKSGSKNEIQAIGSAVYYLQRYTFLAVTGLAAKKMDDDAGGNGGSGNHPITGDQIEAINNLIEDCAKAGKPVDFDKLLRWLDVEALDKMPQAKVVKAMTELNRKLRIAKGV